MAVRDDPNIVRQHILCISFQIAHDLELFQFSSLKVKDNFKCIINYFL